MTLNASSGNPIPICGDDQMGLLDLIYGKNRPQAVSAADLDAKMKALADQASRKVAELEKADKDERTVRANARK